MNIRKEVKLEVDTDEHGKVNYPELILEKSDGASDSERYLIQKCQSTFMSLWSYPNLFTSEKKGKELCDVLALFGNHLFLFSDKFCVFDESDRIEIAWNRWYKHAIEAGAKQSLGAERYIKSKRKIYLDAKLTNPFPLVIPDEDHLIVHRIIVARGIRKACVEYFGEGTGSLIVNTTFVGKQHLNRINRDGTPIFPERSPLFTAGIIIDREHYFHIFDDYTLDCIMDELDTVSDFTCYLVHKERLITLQKDIIAPGEEEILGRYLSIIESERHCIVTNQELSQYQCFEFHDFWQKYLQDPDRLIKKRENEKSYIWDNLLEKAFRNMMDGTLRSASHQDYQAQSILFYRFAEPCRVERRILAHAFLESYAAAIQQIDLNKPNILTFVRRIWVDGQKDTLITIVWMHCPKGLPIEKCLEFRKQCLEAKILSILPSSRGYTYHIGIAKMIERDIDDSEDYIYINANDFPDDCGEIQDAKNFLDSQSNLLGRSARSASAEEYSSTVQTEKIPYPWI